MNQLVTPFAQWFANLLCWTVSTLVNQVSWLHAYCPVPGSSIQRNCCVHLAIVIKRYTNSLKKDGGKSILKNFSRLFESWCQHSPTSANTKLNGFRSSENSNPMTSKVASNFVWSSKFLKNEYFRAFEKKL